MAALATPGRRVLTAAGNSVSSLSVGSRRYGRMIGPAAKVPVSAAPARLYLLVATRRYGRVLPLLCRTLFRITLPFFWR